MHSLCTSKHNFIQAKIREAADFNRLQSGQPGCAWIRIPSDPVGYIRIRNFWTDPTLQSDTKINEPVKKNFTKIKFLGAVVSNIMTYVFQKQLMSSLKRF